MRRSTRLVATLVLTAAAVAYLAWKIDVGTTLDVLGETDLAWFTAAIAIMVGTVPVLALRWSLLLRSHGIVDRLPWLLRSYYVAHAAGQFLPTSLGGDAVRIVETSRRHPGRPAVITGTVVLERGLGGAATVLLGAVGFALSVGRYDVGAYLWLEAAFVLGTALLAFVFFARSARPLLRRFEPVLRRLRVSGQLRTFYESIHHYRARARLLLGDARPRMRRDGKVRRRRATRPRSAGGHSLSCSLVSRGSTMRRGRDSRLRAEERRKNADGRPPPCRPGTRRRPRSSARSRGPRDTSRSTASRRR